MISFNPEELDNYQLMQLYQVKFKDSPTTMGGVDMEGPEFRQKLLDALNSGNPIEENLNEGEVI